MLRIYTEETMFHLSAVRLAPNDVHIWRIEWRPIRQWILEHSCILDENEQETAAGFRYKEDRLHYLTGRILTRILASHYLAAKPEEIMIGRGKYGKPFIVCRARQRLQHNLSHSGEYVLLAFTYKMAVGIDVEEERELPEYRELSQEFHVEEHRLICEAANHRMFYKIWTAKEAFVKAAGKGLLIRLDSFMIREQGIYEGPTKLDGWNLYTFEAAPNYPAALVISQK